jgi:hypothetical protein
MDSWDALRRNLTALIDAARDGSRPGPTGVLQLEAVTKVGKSTLYRILDPREKNPTQLDTLERIARAYGLQPWQLLIPRLDPLDPPALIGAQRMAMLRSVFGQLQSGATADESHELSPVGTQRLPSNRSRVRVRTADARPAPTAIEEAAAVKRGRRNQKS